MDPSDLPRNNARSIFELKGLNKHLPCRSLTSATLALLTKGKLVWPWVLTSQTSSTATCIADHNESSRELWRIPASLPRDIPSPNCNLLLLHYLHWCSKCSKVSGNCIMWKSANLHGYVSSACVICTELVFIFAQLLKPSRVNTYLCTDFEWKTKQWKFKVELQRY